MSVRFVASVHGGRLWTSRVALACMLAASFVTAAAGEAKAEEPRASEEAPPPQRHFHRMIVTFDMIGAAVANRYGVQVEGVVGPRDSIAAYAWYMLDATRGLHDFTLTGDDPQYDRSFDTRTIAGGFDAQYRHYVGGRGGPEAFFVAPGFVAQHFATTTFGSTTVKGDFTPVHQAWSYVGPSLDFGGQYVVPFGLAMGGSIGLHYRVATGSFDESTYPWTWSLTNGPGFRPRFRVWLGWAFF